MLPVFVWKQLFNSARIFLQFSAPSSANYILSLVGGVYPIFQLGTAKVEKYFLSKTPQPEIQPKMYLTAFCVNYFWNAYQKHN